MDASGDLKAIKKKVYMSYFEDGLWDILLGIYLLGWGISISLDVVAVMGGMWVAAYFLILGLKRILVYPRSGYIKLTEARKQHLKMLLLGVVVFIAGLFSFGLFMAGKQPDWLNDYFMLILGFMICLAIVFLGYWWQVMRWYWFAGLLILLFCAHQWLNLELMYTFFISGGAITAYGLYALIRFLKKYPKISPEDSDVLS